MGGTDRQTDRTDKGREGKENEKEKIKKKCAAQFKLQKSKSVSGWCVCVGGGVCVCVCVCVCDIRDVTAVKPHLTCLFFSFFFFLSIIFCLSK